MESTASPLPVVVMQCELGTFVLCSSVNMLYSYTTWFPCDKMYNIVNIKIKVFTFLKHKSKHCQKWTVCKISTCNIHLHFELCKRIDNFVVGAPRSSWSHFPFFQCCLKWYIHLYQLLPDILFPLIKLLPWGIYTHFALIYNG